MCSPAQPAVLPVPDSPAAAVAMAEAGLAYLASADLASVPGDTQADCLRGLARIESLQAAARSGAITAFRFSGGFEADGQQTVRSWLRWQTRVTRGAAGAAVAMAKVLAGHPAVADELAAGRISVSWAQAICDWTKRLPAEYRDEADRILLDAAAGGIDFTDLAGLAEEMFRRTCPPDRDGDDGFAGRSVRLDRTFGGHGSLGGNLTPACRAAVAAMLESLGKRMGPEDLRTQGQRDHDALEEGARRLVASGTLPDRAGQPAQIQLLIPFDRLRDLPGAEDAEAAWAAQAAADGRPGWLLDRASAEGYACDAKITPVVTGHVDPETLAWLTAAYLASLHRLGSPAARSGDSGLGRTGPGACTDDPGLGSAGPGGLDACPGLPGPGAGQPPRSDRDRWPPGTAWPLTDPGAVGALAPKRLRRLQNTLLAQAADVLSGPAGLAAYLRTNLLTGELGPAVSQALDVGVETSTVPAYLRRAVILRDRHCAFPGCQQKPAACQVHHILARAKGGATALVNLLLLCPFHHLIAVHRWGWTIQLHADGTTTATSPDRHKTLHSHGPPTPALN